MIRNQTAAHAQKDDKMPFNCLMYRGMRNETENKVIIHAAHAYMLKLLLWACSLIIIIISIIIIII